MNQERYAAGRFVEARRAATGFPDYPGALPEGLDAAYRVQQAAIVEWGDDIAGWKVGRIQPQLVEQLGAERFVGPIFAETVVPAQSDNPFPAFRHGTAVFEAELVVTAAADAPAGKVDWSVEEAIALIGAINIGIEVAGSPLATINQLSSLVSIAAFGNNNGLILGPEVADWRERRWDNVTCTTTIDGEIVREAAATAVPGGPLEVFAFALGQTARLGWPIRCGQRVSTGAITGMHAVTIGQRCTAVFGGIGTLDCRIVPAIPKA